MLTVRIYISYAKQPSLRRYLAMLFTFMLGLMAKPMIVTLPFTLLLLDFWPLGRITFSGYHKKNPSVFAVVREKIPLFFLSALSSIITYIVQQQSGAAKSLEMYPLGVRITNAIVSYVSYLATLFWPADLAVFYAHQGMPTVWEILTAIIILSAISLLAIKNSFKHPYFIFGWLWYLGTLVPVIGIVQVGAQSRADRYAYLPFIGIYIIIAWMGTTLAKKFIKGKTVPALLSATLIVFLASISRDQVSHWKNSIVLFKHAVGITKNNYIAHTCLANAYFDRGTNTLAKEHYVKALKINPNHANAYYNFGLLLSKEKQTDAAIKHFELSLKIRPETAKTHSALAIELAKKKLLDDSIFHFKEAVRLDPKFIDAQNNLGFAYLLKGDYREAIRIFQTILKNDPLHQTARNNLKIALEKSKNSKIN